MIYKINLENSKSSDWALNLKRKNGLRKKGKPQDVGMGTDLDLSIIYNRSERYLNSISSYWN